MSDPRGPSAKQKVEGDTAFGKALEYLSPGYFALVMGTGIVSIRLHLTGFQLLSLILLWIATVSYVVLWAQVQPYVREAAAWVGLLAMLSWPVGVALYAGIAMLVLLRIIHYGITPQELEPPYWVAMGAMAIAVVAGTNIIDMQSTPMVEATRSLIAGTVVVFWSLCVWLIPMLIGAGVWRHVIHNVPLTYVPTLWSIVFPVGMFAMASINLGRVDSLPLPLVEAIGDGALVAAVLVWALVFLAMMKHVASVVVRTLRKVRD